MAIQISGNTVINDSRELENIQDFAFFVKKPSVTSPGAGANGVNIVPTITGSNYNSLYDNDTRDYREFQVDLATGDFSNAVISEQSNSDSLELTSGLTANTEHKVRIRDVSVNGTTSNFSDEVTFTTNDTFVDTPTITVEGEPDSVVESPVINTSAFSVTGGSDTHLSTDWEVIRTSNSEVVFSSIGDESNLTSITVTESLDVSEEYEFRARHNGTTSGPSLYGSTTANTLATFYAPTTLGEAGAGGFYMGTICAAGSCYYLIVAPNATGCACCQWKTDNSGTDGTESLVDGYNNTYGPLDNATHPAGNWTATRTIGGFSDWYLPAVGELEVFYNNGGNDPLPAGEDFESELYWTSSKSNYTTACYIAPTTLAASTNDPGYHTEFRPLRAVRREPV